MSEKESVIVLDQEKANPRDSGGCKVQTIPKRWTRRLNLREMLTGAYLFLILKNGNMIIEIRRPKEGEVIE